MGVGLSTRAALAKENEQLRHDLRLAQRGRREAEERAERATKAAEDAWAYCRLALKVRPPREPE